MTIVQSPPPERLSDAANMALFQARAAVSEHGGTSVTDVHLLMGLLNAAPNLAPLLSRALPVQRLAECLIGSIVSETMPKAGSEIPLHARVVAILKKADGMAVGGPEVKVEPGHMMLALLQEPDSKAVGCLKQVGVNTESAAAAITEFLNG